LVVFTAFGFSIIVFCGGLAFDELHPTKENTAAKSAEIKRFDFIILVLID
jgi:hypothetical protein